MSGVLVHIAMVTLPMETDEVVHRPLVLPGGTSRTTASKLFQHHRDQGRKEGRLWSVERESERDRERQRGGFLICRRETCTCTCTCTRHYPVCLGLLAP